MKSKSLRHVTHYLVLLALMLTGIVALLFTGTNLRLQTTIVILLALAYFVWGLAHHALEKELHAEIVIEYLLFALLGAGSILAVLYYL